MATIAARSAWLAQMALRQPAAAHPRVEAAPLGELVVLDADAGRAGALELGSGAHHVDRVAVAVVAVSDDRDDDRVDDAAHGLEGLRQRQDVRIGDGLDGGDAEAACPDGVEAGLLGELRGERVVRARRADDTRLPEEQPARFTHEWPASRAAAYSRRSPAGASLRSLL